MIAGARTPVIHRIHGEQTAAQNSAGALAAAFDEAVSQSTTDLADWVSAGLPRKPTAAAKP